jgi:uncharacterized protein YjiS (DUF1127 family)
MTNNQSITLAAIREIRDNGPISSRNTSKGALIQETFDVFKTVDDQINTLTVKHNILVENVIHKTSYQTRRKIWNAIAHRYLSVCPQWVGGALAGATRKGVQSTDFLSLVYLYYTLRDRVTFEFILGPVWNRWQRDVTSIDRGDFLAFLDQLAEQAPHIKKWRETTRLRLAAMTLSALRDLGLLRGKQIKHIQRPPVAPETVYHLLCVLHAEGKEGRAVVEAPDWRLFLWSEAEVSNALSGLAQKRWIEFERAGQTVILRLIRRPEINEQSTG